MFSTWVQLTITTSQTRTRAYSVYKSSSVFIIHFSFAVNFAAIDEAARPYYLFI